jgi:hypothetical protein
VGEGHGTAHRTVGNLLVTVVFGGLKVGWGSWLIWLWCHGEPQAQQAHRR